MYIPELDSGTFSNGVLTQLSGCIFWNILLLVCWWHQTSWKWFRKCNLCRVRIWWHNQHNLWSQSECHRWVNQKKKNHRAFPSCPHNASLSESTLSSWNLVSILTWWGFSGILELRLDLEKTCSDTSWLCLWLCKWTDLTHGWVCTASWRPKCYGKFRALLPNPVLYADGNKISKSWFVGHDSIFSNTTETQKGRNHQRTKENSGLSSTNSRVKWSMYVCEGWGRIETGRER